MKFCTHCQVTCSDQHQTCPLCDVRLIPAGSHVPSPDEIPFFPPRSDNVPSARDTFYRRRPLFIAMVSVFFAVPAFVCLTVDILVNGTASWSLLVLPSLALPWTLILLGLLFHDEAVPMVLAMMAALGAYLYVLGSMGEDPSWALELAIPIVGVLALCLVVALLSIRNLSRKVFGKFAVMLFASSALCFGIDILVSRFLTGSVEPGWSFVVLVSCAPLGVLFLILEKAYERSPRLRRMFHW